MDWSLPGSSVHGILQAAILEWVAISSSRRIFPTQGLNPGLLHWQADSLPLSHQKSPQCNWCLYKKRLSHRNTHAQKEDNVKTHGGRWAQSDASISHGGPKLQADTKVGRGKERFPFRAFGGRVALRHLDLDRALQSLSHVRLFLTPRTAAHQSSLSITNSQSLLKLMSIESVMPSNHLILCHPLLLLSSIFPSIRVFFNESVLHIRWLKYWSFNFSIRRFNEYSGLIFFRMHWLDLFNVQGTLKNLLQHHSSKAPILWCSAFFIVRLSHPHMTTRRHIALTRWTFVGKLMSLLFNMLSRLVVAFLPRSKHL